MFTSFLGHQSHQITEAEAFYAEEHRASWPALLISLVAVVNTISVTTMLLHL